MEDPRVCLEWTRVRVLVTKKIALNMFNNKIKQLLFMKLSLVAITAFEKKQFQRILFLHNVRKIHEK